MGNKKKLSINEKEAAALFELLEEFTRWPYAKQNMYISSVSVRDVNIFKARLEYFLKIKCLGWRYDPEYGYYDLSRDIDD